MVMIVLVPRCWVRYQLECLAACFIDYPVNDIHSRKIYVLVSLIGISINIFELTSVK